MIYCDYLNTITGDQLLLHKEYHDNHYGFPIENEFLKSTGYLSGAHCPEYPVYESIKQITQKNETK